MTDDESVGHVLFAPVSIPITLTLAKATHSSISQNNALLAHSSVTPISKPNSYLFLSVCESPSSTEPTQSPSPPFGI
ncbi:hypothetical protein L1887_21299 [Cichorium endivia]|nr:hypothetical protein L1887_21299 [Cichorium endivia]